MKLRKRISLVFILLGAMAAGGAAFGGWQIIELCGQGNTEPDWMVMRMALPGWEEF